MKYFANSADKPALWFCWTINISALIKSILSNYADCRICSEEVRVTFQREGEHSHLLHPSSSTDPRGVFFFSWSKKGRGLFTPGHLRGQGIKAATKKAVAPPLNHFILCSVFFLLWHFYYFFFFFVCLHGIKTQPCRWNSWCQISFSCRDFRGTTRLILWTESGRAEKKSHLFNIAAANKICIIVNFMSWT